MLLRLTLLLGLLASGLAIPCRAEDWAGYKETSLDAIAATWDRITRNEHPGLTIIEPEAVHLVARYTGAPKPCSNARLEILFTMRGMKDVLKRVPITHCITLTSAKGRIVSAYIQDMLVPGIEKDAKVGGEIEIYAMLFGYTVEPNKADNRPTLMVGRFEPK